jgi:YjjG family noncanonical pyrimidine nucleotidase
LERTHSQKHCHYSQIFNFFDSLFQNKSHIFFDLDHTLWDYNRNCEEALEEIFVNFQLQNIGITNSKILITNFHIVNENLWKLYDTHQITASELRTRRFREIFDLFSISDHTLCDQLHEAYMDLSPNKPHVLPGTTEILEYLHPKYNLHIITNGFFDNQAMKMKAAGITHFFKSVTCSHSAKARKPEKAIFEFALNQAKATVNQSVMIGDNYDVDILGAKNVGMDFVFFNPSNNFMKNEEKSMVKHLLELKDFL